MSADGMQQATRILTSVVDGSITAFQASILRNPSNTARWIEQMRRDKMGEPHEGEDPLRPPGHMTQGETRGFTQNFCWCPDKGA
jgi:hypothetical protein